MVGRKFFMALLDEFQELCRILSCQTVPQPSPTRVYKPRARTVRPSQRVLRSLSTISEEVSYDDMGNKADKVSEVDQVQQDHVLKILTEERVPLKESNFSPYTPLPAIGTATDSKVVKPKAKMVRQETYRVLNPVFVKGPSDLHKFPPLKNVNGAAKHDSPERNGFKMPKQFHKNKQTEKSGTRSDSHRWFDPSRSFFARNVSTESKEPDKESKNKENTTAFWIEF